MVFKVVNLEEGKAMTTPKFVFDLSSEDVSQLSNNEALSKALDDAFASQKAAFLARIDETTAAGHHRVTFDRSIEER